MADEAPAEAPAAAEEPVVDEATRERLQALDALRGKIREHKEIEAKLKEARLNAKGLIKEFNDTEGALNALQSVGQIIGDVLRRLDEERYIVKASSGPRYVVGCRNKLDKEKLKPGTRVTLDMTTLTIMRALPREVDPTVYHMLNEDPGGISFGEIGGLGEQVRELREVIELPLTNPELFVRVGIKAPKGVLLYGPPGTGKTLLARALASNINATFLKVVASAIVDKYIGESARVIREMFGFAKDHQPCVIFMDEVDAIGGSRFSEGTSADREIQRTLMELLNQLDGFEQLGQVKMVMATNRPDILDPAVTRPGRLDQLIHIPLPDRDSRYNVFKASLRKAPLDPAVDLDKLADFTVGFSGADISEICQRAAKNAVKDAVAREARGDAPEPYISRACFEEAVSRARKSIPQSEIDRYDAFSAAMKTSAKKSATQKFSFEDGGWVDAAEAPASSAAVTPAEAPSS